MACAMGNRKHQKVDKTYRRIANQLISDIAVGKRT